MWWLVGVLYLPHQNEGEIVKAIGPLNCREAYKLNSGEQIHRSQVIISITVAEISSAALTGAYNVDVRVWVVNTLI